MQALGGICAYRACCWVQVVIQEGPGWIINDFEYRNHLKKFGMTEDGPCKSLQAQRGHLQLIAACQPAPKKPPLAHFLASGPSYLTGGGGGQD